MSITQLSRETKRENSHPLTLRTASASERESLVSHRFASRVRAADEVPAWFVWASLVLVAGPSFAALAWFQHELFAAAWPGAPAAITLSLAVAVDSFGAMAGVYWFRSKRNAALRAWGRFFAIAAVLGSTALMCTAINRLFPGWEVLGAIPAVIVFGTTKLVTMWQAERATSRVVLEDADGRVRAAEAERDDLARQLADERAQRAELVAQDPPRAEAATQPIPVPERTRPVPATKVASIGGSKSERAEAFIRGEWAAGREPTGAEVDAHVGGSSTGRAVLRKLRDRGERPPSERVEATG